MGSIIVFVSSPLFTELVSLDVLKILLNKRICSLLKVQPESVFVHLYRESVPPEVLEVFVTVQVLGFYDELFQDNAIYEGTRNGLVETLRAWAMSHGREIGNKVRFNVILPPFPVARLG